MRPAALIVFSAVLSAIVHVPGESQHILMIAPLSVQAVPQHAGTDTTKGDAGKEDTPQLKPLDLSADVVARPEDIAAGNYLAPSATANAFAHTRSKWMTASAGFHFALQAPSTTDEVGASVIRTVTSGGVGTMAAPLKIGAIRSDYSRGITLGVTPWFSWQNSKIVKDEATIPSFAFATASVVGSGWAGPVYVGVRHSWIRVVGDAEGYVPGTIDGASINNVMAAFGLGGYFLQFTLLIPPGGQQLMNENLEIRFLRKFEPF